MTQTGEGVIINYIQTDNVSLQCGAAVAITRTYQQSLPEFFTELKSSVCVPVLYIGIGNVMINCCRELSQVPLTNCSAISWPKSTSLMHPVQCMTSVYCRLTHT